MNVQAEKWEGLLNSKKTNFVENNLVSAASAD